MLTIHWLQLKHNIFQHCLAGMVLSMPSSPIPTHACQTWKCSCEWDFGMLLQQSLPHVLETAVSRVARMNVRVDWGRGAEPPAHGPNMACWALETGLRGSPWLGNLVVGKQWAGHTAIPSHCQSPKPQAAGQSWVMTLPLHGHIRARLLPFPSAWMGWGQAACTSLYGTGPLSLSGAESLPLHYTHIGWDWATPPSPFHPAQLGPGHISFLLQSWAMFNSPAQLDWASLPPQPHSAQMDGAPRTHPRCWIGSTGRM